MADSKSGDSATQPPDGAGERTGWASWSLALRAAIVAFVGLVVAFLVVRPFMPGWLPFHWPEARLRAVGLLLAAVIAMPAAYVALRRQVELERSNTRDEERLEYERERESRRQEERSEDQRREARRDLSDRFVTATKLLGDEKAAVRLAGVTALATVADDWGDLKNQEQQQACIDILCDYLRQPHPKIKRDTEAEAAEATTDSPTTQYREQEPWNPAEDFIHAPEEVRVRSAITRTIAKHLRGPRNPNGREAAPGRWSALDFDFSSVTIAWNLDLGAVVFNGNVDWGGATFNGTATWGGATFNGTADWSDATFRRDADWGGATFNATAHWNDATLNGTATWILAIFDGTADWDGATLNSAAHWTGTVFCRNANWSNTTFNDDASWFHATFDDNATWFRATFNDNANWNDATFCGAAHWSDATFTSKPSFRNALTGGAAWFSSRPSFSGSSVADDKEFLADIESMVWPPDDTSAGGDPRPDNVESDE